MKIKKVLIFSALFISVLSIALFFFFKKSNRASPPFTAPEKSKTVEPPAPKISTILARETANFQLQSFKDLILKEGKKCFLLPKEKEFSEGILKTVKDISNYSGIKEVQYSIEILSPTHLKDLKFVFSIDPKNGDPGFWVGDKPSISLGKWVTFSNKISIPEKYIIPDYVVKAYIWNPGNESVYISNILLEFIGEKNINPIESSGKQVNFFYDFENQNKYYADKDLSTSAFVSGKKSFRFDSGIEFSPSFSVRASEVIFDPLKNLSTGVWIYPESDNVDYTLVITLNDKDGKQKAWRGKSTKNQGFAKNRWLHLNHSVRFDREGESIEPDDVIQVYVWNKSKTTGYIDDLEIVYGDPNFKDGADPFVYIDPFDKKEFYHKASNNPPFTSIQLQRIDKQPNSLTGTSNWNNFILTNDISGSVSLNKSESNKYLFVIKNDSLILFHYCNNTSELTPIHFAKLPSIVSNNKPCKAIAGNFDGNEVDEIIVENNEGNVYLISFAKLPSKNVECTDIKLANLLIKVDAINSIIDLSNSYAFDLNKDNVDELVVFNKQSLKIDSYKLNGGTLLPLTSNEVSYNFKAKPNCTFFSIYSSSTQKELFLNLSSSEETFVFSIKENDHDKRMSILPLNLDNKLTHSIFNAENIFLPLPLTSSSNSSFFVCQRNRMNAFWQIRYSNNNFYIANSINFNQTDNKLNPKFYEAINAILLDKNNLVFTLSNCSEFDDSGNYCLEPEPLDGLLPTIQVYSLK